MNFKEKEEKELIIIQYNKDHSHTSGQLIPLKLLLSFFFLGISKVVAPDAFGVNLLIFLENSTSKLSHAM